MGYCIIHKWQHIHRNHQGTANTSHSSKITNARIIHDPNAYSGITKARLTLSMNMNIHSIHSRRKSSLRRVFDLILANVSNMDASYNLHMLNDRFMCCNRFFLFCSSSYFLQQLHVMFHSRWFLNMYPCNVLADADANGGPSADKLRLIRWA